MTVEPTTEHKPQASAIALDMSSLQAFSARLLALNTKVHSSPPNRLLHDAMAVLRELVPFSSAWWGECSEAQANKPPRNWLHGRINLSATFAQEWNQLAHGDDFAQTSIRQLGVAIRFSGYSDLTSEVAAFSRKYALYHSMAITVELPGSGLLLFVSINRDEDSPAFSDLESTLFSEYTAHLLQHWRMRIQDLLLQTSLQASESFAIADTNGNLLFLGCDLGQLIHQLHPQWEGSSLPAELIPLLSRAPCACTLGRQKLAIYPCGELVTIAKEHSGRRTSGLPLSERNAAMLYAKGHSYKEIARLLKLSPSTIRTYLRNAYLHLGVRNKFELGQALEPPLRTKK